MTAEILAFPSPPRAARAIDDVILEDRSVVHIDELIADKGRSVWVRDLVAQYALGCLEEVHGPDDPRCLEAFEECATGGPALDVWLPRWLEALDERVLG